MTEDMTTPGIAGWVARPEDFGADGHLAAIDRIYREALANLARLAQGGGQPALEGPVTEHVVAMPAVPRPRHEGLAA